MDSFNLSSILKGHEDDVFTPHPPPKVPPLILFPAQVRAVLFPYPNLVVSSSRDSSVRLWTKDGSDGFSHSINSAGAGFINSLAWVPPTSQHPKGELDDLFTRKES